MRNRPEAGAPPLGPVPVLASNLVTRSLCSRRSSEAVLLRAARAASREEAVSLVGRGLEISDDCLVCSGVGLGDLGLDGPVISQAFDLSDSSSISVVGLGPLEGFVQVFDRAKIEGGVKARVDLLGCGVYGGLVHVIGGLPGPIHRLTQRDVDGALAPEIAF